MTKLTIGVQVDGLKDLTKALEEFNHNRSYIDGLESWALRSEAENERLREQADQLRSKLETRQYHIGVKNAALRFARGWLTGEFKRATLAEALAEIDGALKCS